MKLIDLFENDTMHEGAEWVPAYRGAEGAKLDASFGVFFTDNPAIAARYAGHAGQVRRAEIDLSAALHWTTRTTERFQQYVIGWRQQRQLPPGAREGLKRFNARVGADLAMGAAIGELLKFPAAQVGWQELDPLMGFVREFARNEGCDVIVRDHDKGGGVKNGTEYIVFSRRRVRMVGTE